MHLETIIYTGLLGLQGLVAARSVSNTDAHVSLDARGDLSTRGVDWRGKPKIGLRDITKYRQLRGPHASVQYDSDDVDTKQSEVYLAHTRSIRGWLLLKVYRQEHFLENEVDIYKGLEGKPIAPEFKALVTDGGKVVGILLKFIESAIEPNMPQANICRNKLNALHAQGIVLGEDFKTDNFLVRGNDVWIIDFEESAYASDDDEFEEDSERFECAFGTW
ncbi:Uu.00g035250.m01.CDS01 [Anthostomella pinea]|uniref:Uu.00g035250.m01.CDS01 n=1 Tax=Anthostomella pinea TaxID=933095 RepID=A0AAI8YDF7_9PEZI|nr:Uu.00g035250.m01.CDS01 [Anthostomella pinea]